MEEQSGVTGRRQRLMSQTEQSNSSSLFPQIDLKLPIECLLRCSRSNYGSIASVNRSFRSLIRSGKLYELRREMGIVEHWVYFPFDRFEWMCLDLVGLGWMYLPRLPSKNLYMYMYNGTLAVGTELLVFGTEIGSPVIYKYSILTNSWSSGGQMYKPRWLFGSASLGEIAIVAGGIDAGGNILSSAEIYNSDTGTWDSLPEMNIPRKRCSGVFMDGNFYVLGGFGTADANVLTCGERYDLETRTWHKIPDMLHEIPNMFPARHRTFEVLPLLAVVKNELYAAFYSENEVRKYDKGRNRWSTVGRLPQCGVPMNSRELAFRAYGDRLIVICVEPRDSDEPSLERGIDVYDCVPDKGGLRWSSLTFNREPGLAGFVYNCTVMGC